MSVIIDGLQYIQLAIVLMTSRQRDRQPDTGDNNTIISSRIKESGSRPATNDPPSGEESDGNALESRT